MFSSVHHELDGLDPVGLSRPELVDAIAALHRLGTHASERLLAFTAGIDALGDHGSDAASVARSVTHRSAREAKRLAAEAAAIGAMPETAAALARGDIGTEHVAVAAQAAERVSPEDADTLVEMASSLPADLFAKKARQWVNRHETEFDAEQRLLHQRRQREGRWWRDKTTGMTHIHGTFDPVAGHEIISALDKRTDDLREHDGGREGSPDDVRSNDQRRADAIHGVVTGSHSSPAVPDPGARRGRSHPRHMVLLHHHLDTGITEFTDGTRVPASVLAEIGPSAEVVGVVFGTDGEVLHLGRSVRLASRAQWIALIARDRGCVRCAAPPARCHAHHTPEWAQDGHTDIEQLELNCHRDHTLVHQHDFDPRRRRSPREAA